MTPQGFRARGENETRHDDRNDHDHGATLCEARIVTTAWSPDNKKRFVLWISDGLGPARWRRRDAKRGVCGVCGGWGGGGGRGAAAGAARGGGGGGGGRPSRPPHAALV